MNNMLMTTTPQLDGIEIEQYLGLVTANQVAGTGFLNDFTASFSDFFGGNSGVYRSEMNELFNDVVEELKSQVQAKRGNAIIGIKVDYDNISAKNMSMFMVTIQGTAVKIKQQAVEVVKKEYIEKDVLETAVRLKVYQQTLRNNGKLKDNDWNYILTHNMSDLADDLFTY